MHETKRSTSFALSLALHITLLCVAFFNFTGSSEKVDLNKPMCTVNLVSLNPSASPAAGETGEPAGAPNLAQSPHPELAPNAPAAPAGPPAVQKNTAVPVAQPRPQPQARPQPKPQPRPQPRPVEREKAEPIAERRAAKTKPVPAKPRQNAAAAARERQKMLKSALHDVERNVSSQSRSRSVRDALRDVRAGEGRKNSVAGVLAALRRSAGGNIFTAGGKGRGGAFGGRGTGAGGSGTGLTSAYGDIVKQIVKRNWRYPAIGTQKNFVVRVEITIAPSGKITAAHVVRSSNNSGFDNSAMRAIQQTQTLPPPPTKSQGTLYLNFNLKELRH